MRSRNEWLGKVKKDELAASCGVWQRHKKNLKGGGAKRPPARNRVKSLHIMAHSWKKQNVLKSNELVTDVHLTSYLLPNGRQSRFTFYVKRYDNWFYAQVISQNVFTTHNMFDKYYISKGATLKTMSFTKIFHLAAPS